MLSYCFQRFGNVSKRKRLEIFNKRAGNIFLYMFFVEIETFDEIAQTHNPNACFHILFSHRFEKYSLQYTTVALTLYIYLVHF